MPETPRMRLTKRRLRTLDTAISLDDVLYEKFRRLHEDLQQEARRFERRKTVLKIAQQA